MDKQEPVALKDCPFCGCEPEPHPQRTNTTALGSYYAVWCKGKCQALGPERRSEAEAIAAWNTRANRPADDCPSCHGLNISCPEGCGRDPLTGELNGTTLIRLADDGLVGKIEALASEAEGEEGLERVVTLASLGDLVRDNLPAILSALRAQSDADGSRSLSAGPRGTGPDDGSLNGYPSAQSDAEVTKDGAIPSGRAATPDGAEPVPVSGVAGIPIAGDL